MSRGEYPATAPGLAEVRAASVTHRPAKEQVSSQVSLGRHLQKPLCTHNLEGYLTGLSQLTSDAGVVVLQSTGHTVTLPSTEPPPGHRAIGGMQKPHKLVRVAC